DLNDKTDLAKVETKLKEDSSITMLVNNAGIGAVVPLLNANIEKMEEIIALNSIALTRLTYAAAPAFVSRGTGTIINISSVVGISPETLNGVYGATKAYVLAFSHSLQHELADKGIRVQAVLPGATATDMWEIAGLPWQKLPPSIVMSVEDVVDAALVGLDQGELVTIPGLHDGDKWTRFEAARRTISQRFGNSVPAPRYRIGVPLSRGRDAGRVEFILGGISVTNDHSVVSAEHSDGDLYTSSQTRERVLNATIVQANISEGFEEYLEIFD